MTETVAGCAIRKSDPNKLVVALDAEGPTTGIFEIAVTRSACRHITGLTGRR